MTISQNSSSETNDLVVDFDHASDQYSDRYLRGILESVHIIALVGASANPARPSHAVMAFLQEAGYRVIPVNPGQAGNEILGETVYADLRDIPEKIDMVDIFRNSEAAASVVEEAIAIGANIVWMQLDVINRPAATRAEGAGLQVVMNRCPKIEMARLSITNKGAA